MTIDAVMNTSGMVDRIESMKNRVHCSSSSFTRTWLANPLLVDDCMTIVVVKISGSSTVYWSIKDIVIHAHSIVFHAHRVHNYITVLVAHDPGVYISSIYRGKEVVTAINVP